MVRRALVVAALLVVLASVVVRATRSDAQAPGQRGLIAFASDRGGQEGIYSVDPGTGTVSAIVDTSAKERDPAWSPDGSKIAYTRARPCGVTCWDLIVRTIATGNEVTLVTSGANGVVRMPAWSPDGSKIAYTYEVVGLTAKDVYYLASSGGAPVQVTDHTANDFNPDWSPDGTQLMWARDNTLIRRTVLPSLGVEQPITLSGTTTPAWIGNEASWSPDGRIAVFGGTGSYDRTEIWVTNSDGTGTSRLYRASSGNVLGPSWAPDASRIVFTYLVDGPIGDLRILRLCTGTVSSVATHTADDQYADWQPVLPAPSEIPPSCATTTTTSAPPPTTTTTSAPPPTTTTTSAPPPTTTTTSAPPPTTTTTSAPPPTTTTSAPPPTMTTTTTSSPPPTPPAPPDGSHMDAADDGLVPTPLSIGRGGTVVWENVGSVTHRVSDASGMSLFDTGSLPTGWSGWHTFAAAGRYSVALDGVSMGRVDVPIGLSRTSARLRRDVTVTWSSTSAPPGYAYDVQIRRPGRSWRLWKDDVTRRSAVFRANTQVGTYRFRARILALADGSHPSWSAVRSLRIRR